MSGALDTGLARQVLDASTELIAVKDRSGRFIAANRAFCAAVGVDAETIRTCSNRDVLAEDAARLLTVSEQVAFVADATIECAVPVTWQGAPATLRAVCRPWHERGRGGVVVVGSCAPPAEPDHARLHALASNIGELSHRFNNALTTVLGLTDWHLFAGNPDVGMREDLQKIRAAAVLAEQTAREIQRLARAARSGLVALPGSFEPASDTAGHSGPRAAGPGARAPGPEPQSAREWVLVVDDQADVRTSLSVMIRTLGFEAHAVDSGEAALAWLERRRASVVITDLGMAGMSGAELAEAIGQLPAAPPVVLLTGWSDTVHPGGSGIARILPKPLRMAQLRDALTSLVGGPEAG